MDERLERNKQFVAEFYDVIINQKDFEKAKKYIGSRYKQHNPLVKDYPEGLCEFIEFLKREAPEAHSEIIRSFAEGDYVILHVHSLRQLNTRGRAIIEIFRLNEDGLIDEHWDVIQEVPAESENPNTMF